ncbi:MAG: tetratricopeptide repeat protein [Vicinamibacterales bacterium]
MAVLAGLDAAKPGRAVLQPAPASQWPFLPGHGTSDDHGGTGAVVWVPDLHEAFVNRQTNATRLVTTQPAYLLEIWRTWIDRQPARRLVATAAALPLTEHAEEALAGRGPWRDVQWIDADGGAAPEPEPGVAGMPAAFRATDPAERLALAGRAYDRERAPELALAMASVCMEVNDLDNAGALLSRVVTERPSWAAGHFELGKYWLRRDDMEAATSAFGEAARLLPGFAPAAANWGATLGELDRTEEALAAFRQALAADPGNSQVHNNLGVVLRETGRLAESEEAFRTVVRQMPDMAFGHYNLGHTLFLQGRYQASLASYLRGQQLDAGRSPLQASRLALARLASGDAHGALRDLRACTANLPSDYRRQVLADTQSVAWAVLSAVPDLQDWRVVGDWLAAELSRG